MGRRAKRRVSSSGFGVFRFTQKSFVSRVWGG